MWLKVIEIASHSNEHIFPDVVSAQAIEENPPAIKYHMRDDFCTHPLSEESLYFLPDCLFHNRTLPPVFILLINLLLPLASFHRFLDPLYLASSTNLRNPYH